MLLWKAAGIWTKVSDTESFISEASKKLLWVRNVLKWNTEQFKTKNSDMEEYQE